MRHQIITTYISKLELQECQCILIIEIETNCDYHYKIRAHKTRNALILNDYFNLMQILLNNFNLLSFI